MGCPLVILTSKIQHMQVFKIAFIIRRLMSLAALFVLASVAFYSVLLARADVSYRENNLAASRSAVLLVPSNAAYHSLLAEHLESSGANPDRELEIATRLSPRESRYWIRRAFRAEVQQEYEDSERYLLEAYRVDRGFGPRWTLMNYYFRRGRFPEFWKSTREALEMSYGSWDPIFRLCLAANDDPSVTRRILPPRREILLSYFAYLTQHERLDSAAPIGVELAAGASADEVPVLMDYCVRQIGHHTESSVAVWNALSLRRLLPYSELAPNKGQIVTNGDFAVPPVAGFDWKFGTEPGVAVGQTDPSQGVPAQGLSIELDGKQPESVRLLEQEIPLGPRMQYVVRYEYRLLGGSGDSGLHWFVEGKKAGTQAGAQTGALSLGASSTLSATEWDNGQIVFSSGQMDAARLVLECRRTPGTLRWKGTLQLRRVTSALVQPGALVPPGQGH